MSGNNVSSHHSDDDTADNSNNDEEDSYNESELSYYENLLKGNEFYLDELVGLESYKSICMISNQSGSSLVTGSRDGTIRCINFDKWAKGGFGDYWKVKLEQSINGLAFNTDESVLAVASGNMLNFYTDGGDFIVSSTKGDMYLYHTGNTKGHTSTVTCVANDPKNTNLFASGSMDGTVRLFDIQSNKQNVSLSLNNSKVYTLSKKYVNRNKHSSNDFLQSNKMNRIGINTICYGNCNYKDILAAGNELGNIIIWDYKTTYQNILIDAHDNEIDTIVSHDDNKLISKSMDSVKVWDLRSTKTHVNELVLTPPSRYYNPCQNMVLSPDNLHLLINTTPDLSNLTNDTTNSNVYNSNTSDYDRNNNRSQQNNNEHDKNKNNKEKNNKHDSKKNQVTNSVLWVVDLEQFEIINKLKINSQLGPLVWAYETNQLFGFTSDGRIYVRCTDELVGANYYTKAINSLEKKNKYSKVNTYSAKPEVYSIDHLPDDLIEVEDGVLKRKRIETQDKYGIPKQDTYDYFKHGKTPITYEDDDIVTKLRSQVEQDPNKELGTEDGIKKIPYKTDRFMAIYKKTQPNLILDFNKPESKHEKMLLGVSKCPRCGIKICQCGYMDRNK